MAPSEEDKENIIHTPEKSAFHPKKSLQDVVLIDSPDLEEVKSATKEKILHIINRGNVKAIMTLKTIGKKRAEAILDARETNGEFTTLESLSLAGLKQSQIDTMFKANLEGF